MSLSVSTFTIPNSRPAKHMTLIFYNDSMMSRGISAFFRLDPRIHNRVKVRVKAKKGEIITGSQRASVMGAMHNIAKQYDYDWERLLAAAKSGSR